MRSERRRRIGGIGVGALCALAGLWAGGCAETRTYSVTISNQTKYELTVGIVRNRGEDVAADSIEQWAIQSPLDTLPPWGMRVPPGKTGDLPPYERSFERGVQAELRVYRGDLPNSELLAVSPDNPHRLDITLVPGVVNEVSVREDRGRLRYTNVHPGK